MLSSGVIVIGVIVFVALLYFTLRMMGTPKGNEQERREVIKAEVESIGGMVISIEQMKRAECPYIDEIDHIEGLCVPYKVNYQLNEEVFEGWAILVMKGSLMYNALVSENQWLMKLE